MSLLHDLVEIFAGDTYIFDAKAIETKKEREKLSLKKLEEIL
jgi:putative hydrolase of HD superfamily